MTISVSQPDWPLNAQQPSLVISKLSHLGLMSVTGEQGRSFIHGQVTTDIASLENDQWRWGAHCDPKGKMLATFRTFAIAQTLFMLMPHDTLLADLPQLKKYAVFSKAELADVSADWLLLGVAGEQAQKWVSDKFGAITAQLTPIEGGAIIRDGERFIIALEHTHADSVLSAIEQPLFDSSAWQEVEILAGCPNLAAEQQNQFVPQMCNLQAVNGISFNKGCYMGQETIARMKYRGGNKRALYIVTGTSSNPISLASQLEIAQEDGDGYRRAGTIVEYTQRGERVLLTAVLANDTELDAKLRFADDENSQLQLLPLPYSLAEEQE